MTASDGTLWRRWLERRDADSLAEIFCRHAGMVHATCRRVLGNAADAEDAAQDCFADLLLAGGTVRSSLAAWLHTIALRRALDLRKRERRRREREQAVAVVGVNTETGGERAEVLALLDEAIARLPEKVRIPVVHRFLRGESHAAIAAELGVSEATVRWYGVLPEAADLRFVLHPDGQPSATPEATRELDPGTLIGQAAPAWEVAEWVEEPVAPARPDRGDGKETLLVFASARGDWEDLGPRLRAVEDFCRRTGAVPVAILPSSAHASAARQALAEYGLGLGVGIDAYRPARGHDTNVTRLRYGDRLRGRVFRIDATGVIRGYAKRIEETESLFRS